MCFGLIYYKCILMRTKHILSLIFFEWLEFTQKHGIHILFQSIFTGFTFNQMSFCEEFVIVV